MRFIPCLAAALAAGTPLHAQQRPAPAASTPPAVSFVHSDTLRLGASDLRTGFSVLIGNSGGARSVILSLHDSDERLPLSQFFDAGAREIGLPPGAGERPATTVQIPPRVGPGSDTLLHAPGRYAGTLRVTDRDGRVLSVRPVAVLLPGARPFVAEWHSDVFKLALFTDFRTRLPYAETRCAVARSARQSCVRDNVLPLVLPPGEIRESAQDPAAGGRAAIGPSRQALLGVVLHKDGRDRGLVWWTGAPLARAGDVPGLELKFTSLDVPGEYRGTLSLGPVAEGEVALTVLVTHDWPLPLALIALSVFLSWALQAYIRSRRALLSLDVRRNDLQARAHLTDEILAELEIRTPGAHPYAVDQALWEELDGIESDTRRIAREGTPLEPSTAEYGALRQRLDRCEDRIAEWERFSHALVELSAAYDAGGLAASRLKTVGPPGLPSVLGSGEAALRGTPLEANQVEVQRGTIQRTTRQLVSWVEVAEAVAVHRETRPEQVRAAAQALWSAASEDDLRKAEAVLWEPAPAPVGAVASPAPRAEGQAPEQWAPAPADDPGAESYPLAAGGARLYWPWGLSRPGAVRRARRTRLRRNVTGFTYHLLTGAVVALTGLNELYFGSPYFGTPQQYLVAVLWGFGGKLGIDMARAVVETRSIPWPGRKSSTSAAAPAPADAASSG